MTTIAVRDGIMVVAIEPITPAARYTHAIKRDVLKLFTK